MISINVQKVQNPTCIDNKISQERRNKGECPRLNNSIYKKPIAHITLCDERLQVLSLRSCTRQVYLFSSQFSKYC